MWVAALHIEGWASSDIRQRTGAFSVLLVRSAEEFYRAERILVDVGAA